MSSLQITSTSGISLEELERLTRPLARHVPLEIDPSQAGFKSFEAPSFLNFFQDPRFWIQTFAGGVAVDLVKIVAKKAWRRRSDLAIAAKSGTDRALKEFVECLAILREHFGASTDLRIGCAVPDDWFGTLMSLEGDQPEQLAIQVSLFLAHLPALERFLDSHVSEVATGFFLSLTDEGDMVIEWQDRASLKAHREVLRLPDVA